MNTIKKLEKTINDLENLINDAKRHLEELKTYKKPNLRIMIPSPVVSPKYITLRPEPHLKNYPLEVPAEEWRSIYDPPEGYVYEYKNLASKYTSPRMGYKLTKIHK
jgi:hypothetical protein